MKAILGIVAGVVAWFAVVIGASLLLRAAAPALSAALAVHATPVALGGRLAISFAGSLAGGALAAWIGGRRAALIAGVLLLAYWATYHIAVIWHQFPIWYHLTFFVSLPLLSWLGGRTTGRRK